MALITTILGVFGAGLGSLFNWAVSWFQSYEQAKTNAANQMDQDISAHATDGEISVSDMNSAEEQLDNLKQQANQLDQPPTQGTKP